MMHSIAFVHTLTTIPQTTSHMAGGGAAECMAEPPLGVRTKLGPAHLASVLGLLTIALALVWRSTPTAWSSAKPRCSRR